jgi:signal transduction histidine kinase
MKQRLWWLLVPAGIAVGIRAEQISIHTHTLENHWLDLAVGWSFIAAGLIAWRRTPSNRTGPLMIAVGFTWFIGNFANSGVPILFSLGSYDDVSQVILAHLLLAYPTGKLDRWERAVIVTAYVWALTLDTVQMLTFDPRTLFHCACLHSPLALFPNRSVFDKLDTAGPYVSGVVAAVVLSLLLRRYARSTPAMRRAMRPLWAASVLTAVVFVSEGVTSIVDPMSSAATITTVLQRVAELLIPIALVFGLLRSRLARSAVADLVTELAGPLPAGGLRDVLARTLGDPSLEIAYWIDDRGEYVDESGRRVDVSSPGERRVATTLEAGERPLAVLIHDPALLEDRRLVDAAGAAAQLALENERLHAEVRAQLEEVRSSRARIVRAADAERRRVERDLHDGAQQRLVTLSLALRMATEQLNGTDPAVRATLEEASGELGLALSELRELARGIHPSILTEAGLGPALESLAERSPVPAMIVEAPERRFSEEVEASAYFVVSESLANAAKHSGAGSVRIGAHVMNGWLLVEVIDDGIGGADPAKGSGLRGLADRVAAVGGRLTVRSSDGRGTRIEAVIPCAS